LQASQISLKGMADSILPK